MGRISTYTAEAADAIVGRITEGEPLRAICRDEAMPAWRTVYDWIDADPEFAARIARARVRGHDAIAGDALMIADTPEIGVETTIKADGAVERREGDMLGHRKLKIETRFKLLAKWDRRYADKMAVGGDPDAPPIQHNHAGTVKLTAEESYKRMLSGE